MGTWEGVVESKEIVPFPGLGHFDVRRRQSSPIQGDTIMGTSPDLSVVNPHLEHWQRSNLFVLGGSIFPKNSTVTPALTMMAQTIRAADTIMERYSKRPSALAQATHLPSTTTTIFLDRPNAARGEFVS
jgi:hypothetical protein